MNKIISCVGLDMRLIKSYTKSVLFLLAIGIFMGFVFKSSETLSSYFMMMIMLVMSYPFAIIDKNQLDVLYGTLSINRKSIVIGRYVFVFILIIGCSLLSLGSSLVLSAILGNNIDIPQLLLMQCVLLVAVSLVVALQYPIYFKLGYTKAKLAAMIPLFVVFALIIMIPTVAKLANLNFTFEHVAENLLKYSGLISASLFAGGMIFLAISCIISCKVYEKKDL